MIKTENPSNKIFIIVIAILLIANIGTLVLLLTSDKKSDYDDRKNSMRNYLKSEVGFSDAQLIAFDTVKSIHRAEVKPMFDEMRTRKQLNLRNIGAQNFSDSSIINAANYAASQQKNLEMKMLSNLKVIRNLCTSQQRLIFDTGFYKMMTRPNSEIHKK
jgi:hypothetical protein